MDGPLPVILTTNAVTPERIGLAVAALAHWQRLVAEGAVVMTVLDARHPHARAEGLLEAALAAAGLAGAWPRWLPLDHESSLRTRHVMAAEIQRGLEAPWAVWTDDDILVNPNPAWLGMALGHLMLPTPVPWGLVAVWLREAAPRGWPRAHTPRPIAPEGSVGGCRFVRLGVPATFPPYRPTAAGRGYDPVLCAAVRAARHDVGIFTDEGCQAVHAGRWASAVHPIDLTPGQPVPR